MSNLSAAHKISSLQQRTHDRLSSNPELMQINPIHNIPPSDLIPIVILSYSAGRETLRYKSSDKTFVGILLSCNVLDGSEIEPQWGARFSAAVYTGPEAH
jgi:hypothetical protein